ncbi:hypothetical protein ACGFMK_23795 [Amycolatopsis sp. NPDC049252]|uniref:hypothetical protein n=1 Tax=Amycolatopsis sp. NPDC049252 TaxID=3363933 RepID=UPI003718632A
MSEPGAFDPRAMAPLLWRLADRFTRGGEDCPGFVARPDWFDHAGNLVVVDGTVRWNTPGVQGGFCHSVPVGTHPVYVGTYTFGQDDWKPDEIRYFTSVLVIPFAGPARIDAAQWDEGYDDHQELEDYAVLCDDRADGKVEHPGPAGEPSLFEQARDRIRADGPRYRRHNWVDQVVDPATGANAMIFPADAEAVYGIEAEDENGELLCLVFTACSF